MKGEEGRRGGKMREGETWEKRKKKEGKRENYEGKKERGKIEGRVGIIFVL